MTQSRLRQLLVLAGISLAIPVAMSANIVDDSDCASSASAGSAKGSGDDEDNDVFAASHLASQFEAFSGSRQNAQNLITGLRYGSRIRLSANDPNGLPAGLIFTPPTRAMRYGEIRRALSLAQAQLANRGVTSPTPEQLHVALMGGSFTNGEKTVGTTGVLQLRSQGMDWSRIAMALSLSAGDDARSNRGAAAQSHGDVGAMMETEGMSSGVFIATASGGRPGFGIGY